MHASNWPSIQTFYNLAIQHMFRLTQSKQNVFSKHSVHSVQTNTSCKHLVKVTQLWNTVWSQHLVHYHIPYRWTVFYKHSVYMQTDPVQTNCIPHTFIIYSDWPSPDKLYSPNIQYILRLTQARQTVFSKCSVYIQTDPIQTNCIHQTFRMYSDWPSPDELYSPNIQY